MHFLIGSAIVVAMWCFLTGNGTNYRLFWRFLSFCFVVLALFLGVVLFILYFGQYFPSL